MIRTSRAFDVLLAAWSEPGEWTPALYAEDTGCTRKQAAATAATLRARGLLRHGLPWRVTREGRARVYSTLTVPIGDPRPAAPGTVGGTSAPPDTGTVGGGATPQREAS